MSQLQWPALPTDTQGNLYKLAAAPIVVEAPGFPDSKRLLCQDPAPAGTNIVTVKFNAVAVYPDVRILDYSGIDPVNPSGRNRRRGGEWRHQPERGPSHHQYSGLAPGGQPLLDVSDRPLFWFTGFTQRLLTSPSGTI
jgi:hypothetical protein